MPRAGLAKDSSQVERDEIVHFPAWEARQIDADGTAHVPAFCLPESSLLSSESRAELKRAREFKDGWGKEDVSTSMEGVHRAEIPRIRERQAAEFYRSSNYGRLRALYDVIITPRQMGRVYTEVFTPKDGVAARNKNRVLINLHGGHFLFGARMISHLESIPIASIGKIKVISIDYRMAPEYKFPAACEDVAAVYGEVLKSYLPQNVGIYGCSAGGLLTAETIAWCRNKSLALPAAVGMLCAGASYYQEGISARIASAVQGFPFEPSEVHPYFADTDSSDPLAFPIHSRETMANFPPSLLIASTADLALSSVVHTHSVLVKLGVKANLHVWEGVDHGFFYNPNLPESFEAFEVILRFFDKHLKR